MVFECLHYSIWKLLKFKDPSSIDHIFCILNIDLFPRNPSLGKWWFLSPFFPIFISKWSIHMSSIFASIEKGWMVWNSNRDFSEETTVSIIIGRKGDKFGEKICKVISILGCVKLMVKIEAPVSFQWKLCCLLSSFLLESLVAQNGTYLGAKYGSSCWFFNCG